MASKLTSMEPVEIDRPILIKQEVLKRGKIERPILNRVEIEIPEIERGEIEQQV